MQKALSPIQGSPPLPFSADHFNLSATADFLLGAVTIATTFEFEYNPMRRLSMRGVVVLGTFGDIGLWGEMEMEQFQFGGNIDVELFDFGLCGR